MMLIHLSVEVYLFSTVLWVHEFKIIREQGPRNLTIMAPITWDRYYAFKNMCKYVHYYEDIFLKSLPKLQSLIM